MRLFLLMEHFGLQRKYLKHTVLCAVCSLDFGSDSFYIRYRKKNDNSI